MKREGFLLMDERNEWKLNELPELAKKDIYKPVYLNKYGYYELRRQNTREERNANFEEHYFQEYAGAGASVPLLGFGNVLWKGIKEAVDSDGFLGIFKGGFTASAVGISAAMIFAYLASLIFQPKMKK